MTWTKLQSCNTTDGHQVDVLNYVCITWSFLYHRLLGRSVASHPLFILELERLVSSESNGPKLMTSHQHRWKWVSPGSFVSNSSHHTSVIALSCGFNSALLRCCSTQPFLFPKNCFFSDGYDRPVWKITSSSEPCCFRASGYPMLKGIRWWQLLKPYQPLKI